VTEPRTNQEAGEQVGSEDFWTEEARSFCRSFRDLQKQTGAIVPPRKALTASSAKRFLPYLSILEFKSPELMTVRLVGTAIVNRTHIDNTGRNMFDLMPPQMRLEAAQGFEELLTTPCGATYVSLENYQNGSAPIEIVSFPFNDASGKTCLIVSLSVETDRQELLLRGEEQMVLGAVLDKRLIDIGAGIGKSVAPATANATRRRH
jgi:PAS domain